MSKFRNLIESVLLEMSSVRIPKGDYDEFRDDTFIVYKNPTTLVFCLILLCLKSFPT